MKHIMRWITVTALVLTAVLLCSAQAQDFYGEGNVLIAVDMGSFRVNEEAEYPEGTMGTLVWGEDALSGTSTRPAFAPRMYTPTLGVVPAEEYEIGTVYEVGQTLLFPYLRVDDPEFSNEEGAWLPEDAFPEEVIARGNLLIAESRIDPETGGKEYSIPCAETDGVMRPCVDFLEIECVAVTEYSTIWQYTGNVYSNRPTFDSLDYLDAIHLSKDEIKRYADICDRAYQTESEIYGDPHWEDAKGDRDGKAAYVVFDFSELSDGYTAGYYNSNNTAFFGFDCLVMNAAFLPGRRPNSTYAQAEEYSFNIFCHELNHDILLGCLGDRWSMWLGESFAQNAIDDVRPGNSMYLEYYCNITNECTRARMITGMLWGDEWGEGYPPFKLMPYTLGNLFLQYVERLTVGETTGALWTEYFAEQTPGGGLTNETLDAFLQKTTGESLDAWMAQFLAALITGGSEGPYAIGSSDAIEASRPDLRVFLRERQDFGQYLTGFDPPGAADSSIANRFWQEYGFTAVSGGGTTFAYRNDKGGPISITGADDRWYFFAVTMELPDLEEVIEISDAKALARIGNDPAYPLSGSYILTEDIDLAGSRENPWTPIGKDKIPFIGVFDGNGKTIEGLYIDSEYDYQGLFGQIGGNAVVRDLNVKGSVSGDGTVGGIVGCTYGGAVTNCSFSGTLTGREYVGGIAGYHYVADMSGCVFSGTVKGEYFCGGIAGYNSWAQISNCRSVSDVSGDEDVGGVAGMNAGGTVERCYHTGSVSAGGCVGGVTGWIRDDGVLRNCYHTGPVSGEEDVGSVCGGIRTGSIENCYSLCPGLPVNGTILESATLTSNYVLSEKPGGEDALTGEEFTRPESFVGWDFENVWSLENGVRPILRDNPEPTGAGPDM